MSHTIELNGQKYVCNLHPGEEGLEVGARVTAMIGPVALELQSGLGDEVGTAINELPESKKAVISSAYGKLLAALPPKELLSLAKELFRYTRLDSEAQPLSDKYQFDSHFRGNYKQIVPLMREVIKLNGFLDLSVLDLLT